jgi:hypothetical protein
MDERQVNSAPAEINRRRVLAAGAAGPSFVTEACHESSASESPTLPAPRLLGMLALGGQ